MKEFKERRKYKPYAARLEAKNYYMNRFYNLWFNSYKWNGLDYTQIDYIMTQLWSIGKIACFKIKNAELLELTDSSGLAFSDYAPLEYNIYMNFPIRVNIIPKKYAPFLPSGSLRVDKDIVLGYAQRNKQSIRYSIEYLVDKIIDVEMIINIVKETLKAPFLVVCSEEDKERMKALWDNIFNDELKLFVSGTDAINIKTLNNNSPFILDKLYAYKQERENEALTYLGIDNISNEKKEHLIVDEVNANNDIINNSGDCCLNCLEEFCNRVNNVLNVNISVEATAKPVTSESNKEVYYD